MFQLIAALALCAVALVSPLVQGAETRPILIKLSHVVAEDTPKGKGALLFQRLVAERLPGQVKVEVYPNSALFGDADELEALRNNEVQMLAPSLAKFERYTQRLQVFDMPFLFDDLAAVDRFQKRAKGRELLRAMEKQNILGLAFWHNGMKQLSATRPLYLPADAAGLSFRIQSSTVLDAQFKQLGASAVKMPFAEVFQALRSGRVQGAENPWSNILSQKLDSVQPFITETNHGALDYMLVSNARFWYSIPHGTRAQLEGIIDEVSFAVNQDAEAQNAADRAKLLAAGGSRLISLTDAQRQAWRDAMQPVWQQFEEPIGKDMLRAAQMANRKR